VLEAFADGFWISSPHSKVAFGGLVRKLRDLVRVFTKAPRLWEKFKQTIGVSKLSDLPGAIRDLAKKGYAVLKKAVGKAFKTWPLKIYTLPQDKLWSINDIIEKIVDQSPAFKRFLSQKVRPRVDQLDQWLRKYLPGISTVAMVAIFIWIWLNVVEFEWDLHALSQVLIGQITLADLLASLPGSAIGFLMNSLGLGTFTLLPATIIARLLFLLYKRYVTWDGGRFRVDWDLLKKDRLAEGPLAA
jgi:hypothetical protein